MRSTWLCIPILATLLGACGNDDLDGDGFAPADGDCNDEDAAVNPDATETPYNGIDDDCNARTLDDDLDEDGFDQADDCDDDNAARHPNADELCNDIDDNCNSEVDEDPVDPATWYRDTDGDGFAGDGSLEACASPGADYFETPEDCDDADKTVFPGAAEICDSVDNDCDDLVDADDPGFDQSQLGTWYRDQDNDSFGDINDPIQACSQPKGYVVDDTDCDDTRPLINPDADELCNDEDDNCDTIIDNDPASGALWFEDVDSDGYGDTNARLRACERPDGYVSNNTDCVPTNGAINPGATEICNTIDDDCDTIIDDADSSLDKTSGTVYHADTDLDTFGDPATAEGFCIQPTGYVLDGTDCDDTTSAVQPNATEVCNGIDDDCDTNIDDADDSVDSSTFSTYYSDTDGDRYGNADSSVQTCDPPSGYVADDTDCDDNATGTNPGAQEVCDADDVDEDCDTLADDDDDSVDSTTFTSWFADTDGDTYGDASAEIRSCEQPASYVTDAEDCDDGDAAIHPAATEVCDVDDVDEDCDGLADDADDSVDATTFSTFYADSDGDGYGDAASTTATCDAGAGFVVDSTDCDDAATGVNPGATEVCDDADVDEDCDDLADDADDSVDPTTFSVTYPDADGDTFGDSSSANAACEIPAGYIADGSDCNDADAAIHPDATEVCDADNVDEDCDSLADNDDDSTDAAGFSTWYADVDNDTFGDAATPLSTCDQPAGYVVDATDCNDDDALVNPGETEVCDDADVDEDCNDVADDADTGVDTTTYTTYYADSDGDAYGDASVSATMCNAPTGYVTDRTDCDDTAAGVNPGATEICDSGDVDEDCDDLSDDADSSVDETTFTTWYSDADGDGFGDSATSSDTCDAPAGYVSDSTDCDDSGRETYPGAAETESTTACMRDDDLDGWGDDTATAPIATGTDCDDTASTTNPGATDTPQDGTDQDCSGTDAPYAVTDLGAGDLVITEIMKDPAAVADADGEWFEIVNLSGGEVDLDGLYVADGGTDEFTVSGELLVAADGYVLFAINDDDKTNGGLPTVDYAYTGMTLDEADDEIELYTSSTGDLIDEVAYDDTDFPSNAGESLSLTPDSDDADNDTGSNWCDGTSTYGSGDLGTPGDTNDAC